MRNTRSFPIGKKNNPVPGPIVISRTVGDSNKSGGNVRGHRVFNLSSTGTTVINFQFPVPLNWNSSTNPKAYFVGFTNGNDISKNYRFEIGAEYTKHGEEVEDTDDEANAFTESAPDDDFIQLQTPKQELDKANIEPGDIINLLCKRIGGDAADTRSNGFDIFMAFMDFERTDFGVHI